MDDIKGGYDVYFVENISAHLKCVICQLALRNPICLAHCGHKLCKSCFEDLKRSAVLSREPLLCPHDRTAVNSNKIFDDTGLARMILDLKVKCDNYNDGCTWTGELSNLEHHLNHNCVVKEKEVNTELLLKMEQKVQTYERKILQNESAIETLTRQNVKLEDVFVHMSKKMDLLENNMADQLRKVVTEKKNGGGGGSSDEADSSSLASLDYEKGLGSPLSSSTWKSGTWKSGSLPHLAFPPPALELNSSKHPLPLCGDGDVEVHPGPKQISPDDVDPIPGPSYVRNQNQGNHCSVQLTEVNKELAALQNSVRTLEQIVANKTVVFKWVISNYAASRDCSEAWSPKFLCGIDGHCCQLRLNWHGFNKETMGISIYVCRDDVTGRVLQRTFRYEIKIEITGRDEDRENVVIPFHYVMKNQDRFKIHTRPFANVRSRGVWVSEFLSMPRLNDFVFRDNMFLTCVMTPK